MFQERLIIGHQSEFIALSFLCETRCGCVDVVAFIIDELVNIIVVSIVVFVVAIVFSCCRCCGMLGVGVQHLIWWYQHVSIDVQAIVLAGQHNAAIVHECYIKALSMFYFAFKCRYQLAVLCENG